MGRVIRHLSEGFWSGSTWADIGETAFHYWVGPAPRLAVADEAAAYARIEAGDPYTTVPVAVLPAFSYDPALGIRVNAQVRFTGTWPTGTVLSLGLSPDFSFALGGAFNSVFDVPVGAWETVGVDITPSEAAAVLEYAQAGQLVAFATVTVDDDESYDISYIEVVVSGTPPLRLMQRGDGLGMGSGRVFGAGTRQGSTRVFGSL